MDGVQWETAIRCCLAGSFLRLGRVLQGWALKACLYECHYIPILEVLAAVQKQGVDVKIVMDSKVCIVVWGGSTAHHYYRWRASWSAQAATACDYQRMGLCSDGQPAAVIRHLMAGGPRQFGQSAAPLLGDGRRDATHMRTTSQGRFVVVKFLPGDFLVNTTPTSNHGRFPPTANRCRLPFVANSSTAVGYQPSNRC